MGYVHDTAFATFTAPEKATPTVGTWAMAVASNVWSLDHSAANDTSVVKIPLELPQNSAGLKGARIKSVDIWYSIATAACDAVSAALYKSTLPSNGGSAPSAAAVATSYDSGHDTAAERYAVAVHKMTLTITAPEWVDDDSEYFVELTVDAAATSAVKFFGARANFDLRM